MHKNDPDRQRQNEKALISKAVEFAQKHGLDPLDAVRDFLDVALICRGTAAAVCRASRYN